MSEMSSFYGGKQGASIIIVKKFDGINIPQIAGQYIYKRNAYAVDTNNDFIITDQEHGGNVVIDENNDIWLIAQTGDNYADYNWLIHENDGAIINNTIYHFPEELAEGMVQCFAQGATSANEVRYGEYVLIDTIEGLKEYDNPDNGKVFRRGMDLTTELAGAEYIGQIVGPRGELTQVEFTTFDIVHSIDPHVEVVASELNDSLVPGSYIDDDIRAFNDVIKYDYAYLRDAYGNIKKCLIGMQIPTLVDDFEATSMSPYENRATDPTTGKYYNYDLIDEDPVQYVNGKWVHPFYQKWQIKVPHGYHGINVTNFEIIPTKTKPKDYIQGFAGTPIYSDKALTTPVLDSNNDPVILEISYTVLRGAKYEDNVNWMAITYDGNEVYTSRENGCNNVLRYRETNYDNLEAGEVTYYELTYYEPGHIILDKNGYVYPQRQQLQFTGVVSVEDDNVNGKTKVKLPTKLSEFENDPHFIDKDVDNLTYYYKKTETYNQTEIDNKISQLINDIDWKEAVKEFSDLATTYPNPQEGWTVNVTDDDMTYRWTIDTDHPNGAWIAISANAIPIAEAPSVAHPDGLNGLMTPAQVVKLAGIEAGAEVNVQADWDQADNTKDDYIKNKITPITSAHIQSLFT